MIFRARQHKFVFPRPALVMGILNVTPDSFSDGGKYFDEGAAVARGGELAAQGAEIIDIGGESTRPGAEPVEEREELRRVIPVIEKLAGRVKSLISIDTMKPGVARAALDAGADIINDVGAHRADAAMVGLVAESGAGYVALHMRGEPRTMQINPAYDDAVATVRDFFLERLKRLNELGVAGDQVALDPGIGFGKALEHNLQLLAALESFTNLGRPVVLGVSRKSFLGKISESPDGDRLPAALACAALAIPAGVAIIRAHDVLATIQAVRMAEAILTARTRAPGEGTGPA